MAADGSHQVPAANGGGASDLPVGSSIASTGKLSLSQKLGSSLSRLRRGGKSSVASSSRADQLRKDIDFTGGGQPGLAVGACHCRCKSVWRPPPVCSLLLVSRNFSSMNRFCKRGAQPAACSVALVHCPRCFGRFHRLAQL